MGSACSLASSEQTRSMFAVAAWSHNQQGRRQRRQRPSRRRASADPIPHHLYLGGCRLRGAVVCLRMSTRTVLNGRSWQNRTLPSQNRTALFGASPTFGKRSPDVRRHGVGKVERIAFKKHPLAASRHDLLAVGGRYESEGNTLNMRFHAIRGTERGVCLSRRHSVGWMDGWIADVYS